MKASKFGYATANGTATVTEDATATVDLALAQAPSATVSGTVRTALGLAAGAEVALLGTPLAAKTDAQGRYSVTAPAGEYDLKATHETRCADPLTQHLVLTANTTLDLDPAGPRGRLRVRLWRGDRRLPRRRHQARHRR